MKSLFSLLLAMLVASTIACGYSSKAAPAQPGAIPAITQLAPNTATSGDGPFTLTVNGTAFARNAKVNWNGMAQPTMFVNANQLAATIPSSVIATPGTATVSVTNPATAGTGVYGGGGTLAETSNTMDFTVN
jgi:uncharacterized protein (TIGR03437 family)